MKDIEGEIISFSFINRKLNLEGYIYSSKDMKYLAHNRLYVSVDDEDNCIIIRTVEFINRGEGKFKNLFTIMKGIMEDYNFNSIILENVNNCCLQKWCKKNSLKKLNKNDSYQYIPGNK